MLKATEAYCYKEVRNYEKILFIQSTVENSWWGDASTTSPPLDPTRFEAFFFGNVRTN